MTMKIAGPLLTENAAREYMKDLARERNLAPATGGMFVRRGFDGWYVYEYL